MKKLCCLILFQFLLQPAWLQQVHDTLQESQTFDPGLYKNASEQVFKRRQIALTGVTVAAIGGSLLVLNEAWYRQYERTSFHTFNDSREWLQVDKAGHAWSAYQLNRLATASWQWAGLSAKKATLIGTASSLGYMTVIEWLDGYSEKWGWSWTDMAANTAGTLLFAAQHLAWQEQRIQLKFSVYPRSYPQDLQARTRELFGKSKQESLLKDYNVQTYWLSANLKSFWRDSRLPAWLNLSLGYGATGMYGGMENLAFGKDGQVSFDRRDIPRLRQWYLAPDVDFSKIPTQKKGIKLLLTALNCLKFPAPALMLSDGKFRFEAIAF